MPYIVGLMWVSEDREPFEQVAGMTRSRAGDYISPKLVKIGTPKGLKKYVDYFVEEAKKETGYHENYGDEFACMAAELYRIPNKQETVFTELFETNYTRILAKHFFEFSREFYKLPGHQQTKGFKANFLASEVRKAIHETIGDKYQIEIRIWFLNSMESEIKLEWALEHIAPSRCPNLEVRNLIDRITLQQWNIYAEKHENG